MPVPPRPASILRLASVRDDTIEAAFNAVSTHVASTSMTLVDHGADAYEIFWKISWRLVILWLLLTTARAVYTVGRVASVIVLIRG